MDEEKFTHIGVKRRTQRQVAFLAKVHDVDIYSLVGSWADDAWQDALQAGLVTDKMLVAAPVNVAELSHE
jgi:hypothetical protein